VPGRSRQRVPLPQGGGAAGHLFVSISQSGETADTLAALRNAKELGFLGSLAICNVGISSLVRESDLTLLTQAGREIGVPRPRPSPPNWSA
jgi:glucosamine 6-phosphate synthetase-like amidotransferase/phosphosugar isomerase protein